MAPAMALKTSDVPLKLGLSSASRSPVDGGDDRGIVGIESLIAEGLAFFVIHTVFDVGPVARVPA